jgi:hypothetical protein
MIRAGVGFRESTEEYDRRQERASWDEFEPSRANIYKLAKPADDAVESDQCGQHRQVEARATTRPGSAEDVQRHPMLCRHGELPAYESFRQIASDLDCLLDSTLFWSGAATGVPESRRDSSNDSQTGRA